MAHFVIVPQWQGSAAARAMLLAEGAAAIARDLPASATTVVEVPVEAGDTLGTRVARLSALEQTARHQFAAMPDTGPSLTIGGDAGVATTAAIAAISGAHGAMDPGAVVVWLSATPAMHSPDTSATGAYAEMAAGALIGTGAPVPADPPLLAPERLVLAGIRDISSAEADALRTHPATTLSADEITAHPAALAEAVARLAPTSIFIHVALDVLDPAAIDGVLAPYPFGLEPATLLEAIAALRRIAPLSGAALTGFAPPTPDEAIGDMGTILRLIGALV